MAEMWIKILLAVLFVKNILCYDERCPKNLGGEVDVFKCTCYQFTDTETYWNNNICTRNGGALAKINSRDVNSYLKTKLSSVYRDEERGVWIGATRVGDSKNFTWTDGSPVEFSNWADGEPDHIVIKQNCVYMKRIHIWAWATLQCDFFGLGYKIPSVCQYEIKGCTTEKVESIFDNTAAMIGIVIGAIAGVILVGLLICWLIVCCKRTCSRYRKRKRQQRSVRYYSGAPSRQSSNRPTTYLDGDDETGENQLNDDLMAAGGSDSPTLNIKGLSLPTADSIAADTQPSTLVVDVNTGKGTIKKMNTKSRGDNASTRSLKSFRMDADRVSHDRVSHDQVSNQLSLASQELPGEDDGLLNNLDNVDKPNAQKYKDLSSSANISG